MNASTTHSAARARMMACAATAMVAACLGLVACGSGTSSSQASSSAAASSEAAVTSPAASDTVATSPAAESPAAADVPAEYASALNKAKSYSDMMHMSKQGIYDQLTSEYGDKFTQDEADYAVAHLND